MSSRTVRELRLRRTCGYAFVAALFTLDIFATGFFGGSERTLGVIRSIVLPGLPFLEWHVPLGIATIAIMLAAVAAWLRFGIAWLPVAVILASVTIAATLMPLHHGAPASLQHGHEQPAEHSHSDTHGDGHDSSNGRSDSADSDSDDSNGHGHKHDHQQGGHQSHKDERSAGPANDPHGVYEPGESDSHPDQHPDLLSEPSTASPDPTPTAGRRPALLVASHEFTIVLVVFAFLARLRLLLSGLPGQRQLLALFPAGLIYPAVTVARAAAIEAIAGADHRTVQEQLTHPGLRARAARINRWARLRPGQDSLAGAHAHLRAALALCGGLTAIEQEDFRREADASLAGTVESEPGWVRLLDGMLVAIALARLTPDPQPKQDSGKDPNKNSAQEKAVECWLATLTERFALHHGRRVAALHTASMLGIGTAALWEHAAATALAYREGWLGREDWDALRARTLGAAARGARDPESLRLIAAGQLWADLTDDAEARTILGRRTVMDDPIALALTHLV